MLNDLSSPAALAATRRSGKPREMVAPGPDEAQLRRILTAAMRVPDHGKIAPWRFVVIAAEQRAAFAALLERAYRLDKPEPTPRDIETLQQFAHQAIWLVVFPGIAIILSALSLQMVGDGFRDLLDPRLRKAL